jgi:hypothetical protein
VGLHVKNDTPARSSSTTLARVEQQRLDLHLHRIKDSPEGKLFVAAVAEAIQLPLENLHEHVGPYPLFQPGKDNSTDTHQRFYGQHAQQQQLYKALCKRVIQTIGESC